MVTVDHDAVVDIIECLEGIEAEALADSNARIVCVLVDQIGDHTRVDAADVHARDSEQAIDVDAFRRTDLA